MLDELKERNILKLILIVRFACAPFDVRHPIVVFIVIQDPSNPFRPMVEKQLQFRYFTLVQKSHYSLKKPFWLELYVSSPNCARSRV
jgi:hypothetical protein